MDTIITKLSGAQFIALFAIGGALLLFGSVMLSAIIAPQWRRVRQVEAETRLKQDLLAAGMSSLEIIQIVQASGDPMRSARHLRDASRASR